MRRFHKQTIVSFKYSKIKHKTDKAILFEIEPKISIWVPKSWIKSIKTNKFNVARNLSVEIRLKIKAEREML